MPRGLATIRSASIWGAVSVSIWGNRGLDATG